MGDIEETTGGGRGRKAWRDRQDLHDQSTSKEPPHPRLSLTH